MTDSIASLEPKFSLNMKVVVLSIISSSSPGFKAWACNIITCLDPFSWQRRVCTTDEFSLWSQRLSRSEYDGNDHMGLGFMSMGFSPFVCVYVNGMKHWNLFRLNSQKWIMQWATWCHYKIDGKVFTEIVWSKSYILYLDLQVYWTNNNIFGYIEYDTNFFVKKLITMR